MLEDRVGVSRGLLVLNEINAQPKLLVIMRTHTFEPALVKRGGSLSRLLLSLSILMDLAPEALLNVFKERNLIVRA